MASEMFVRDARPCPASEIAVISVRQNRTTAFIGRHFTIILALRNITQVGNCRGKMHGDIMAV